jgi:hypothetical protein
MSRMALERGLDAWKEGEELGTHLSWADIL